MAKRREVFGLALAAIASLLIASFFASVSSVAVLICAAVAVAAPVTVSSPLYMVAVAAAPPAVLCMVMVVEVVVALSVVVVTVVVVLVEKGFQQHLAVSIEFAEKVKHWKDTHDMLAILPSFLRHPT